jgi:hypothetical protein
MVMIGAVAAAAGAVGRATAPAELAQTPTAHAIASDRPTKRGALAAAASWLSFNQSRQELLDPGHRRATVSRFVASGAQAKIAARLDQAAKQLRAELVGPAATVRDAPIGYRLASYTPEQAIVQTWEAVVRAGLNAEPQVLLATSTLLLVWERGWRVQDVDIRAQPPAGWTASDVAAADNSFSSFRHVP